MSRNVLKPFRKMISRIVSSFAYAGRYVKYHVLNAFAAHEFIVPASAPPEKWFGRVEIIRVKETGAARETLRTTEDFSDTADLRAKVGDEIPPSSWVIDGSFKGEGKWNIARIVREFKQNRDGVTHRITIFYDHLQQRPMTSVEVRRFLVENEGGMADEARQKAHAILMEFEKRQRTLKPRRGLGKRIRGYGSGSPPSP